MTRAPYDHEPVSLRDFLAAHALQGMLASGHQEAQEAVWIATGHSACEGLALAAYGFADAMLRIRQADTPTFTHPQRTYFHPDDFETLSVRSRRILTRNNVTCFEEIPDRPEDHWLHCGEIGGSELRAWKCDRLSQRNKPTTAPEGELCDE